MTITVDFSPQASAKIKNAAKAKGIAPEQLLENLVTQYLTDELNSTPMITFAPPGKAAANLRARLLSEATNNVDQIRSEEASLEEIKLSLNLERERSGAEKIF